MSKIKKPLLLTLMLFWIGAVSAQEIAQNPKLVKGRLDNGLTYYILPNDFPKGQAIYRLFIKSGSVYETEDQRGLAHFLEHMAFNGTNNFPGNSLIPFLESKGARFGRDLNAHTSYNETVYKLTLPSNTVGMVDTTLTILADWLDGLLLEEEEIDAERGVIMSEWLSKQRPEAEVNDALLMELMNNSRFAKRKVIGDTAVIKNFEYSTLRDYYESWYQPNLAAVAVVGDVDPILVEGMIKEKFSYMTNENPNIPEEYTIPEYENHDARVVVHESLKKPELTMIQLVPMTGSVRNESDYYQYLIRNIINRLIRARFNALSFDHNDYSRGSMGISDFLNTKGIALGSVELLPNKIETGIASYISHVEQIKAYGFLAEEIEKVKRAYISAAERRVTSAQPINSSRYMDELCADFYKDYVVTTPEEELRLTNQFIDTIDSTTIVNNLQDLVADKPAHFIFSSFEEGSLTDSLKLLNFIDSVRNIEVDPYELTINVPENLLENEPEPGYIVDTKDIPEISAKELLLSNGVKLIYKKAVSGKNRVNISAYKKGGRYALDPADYVTSRVAASVVALSGAGDLSRDELSHFLAGNSASMRLLIENTRTGLVGSSAFEDVETMFQLLHLKWTQPRAERDVFDLTKKRLIEEYQNKNVTEQTVYYQDLNYLINGKDYVTRELTDTIIEEEMQFEKIIPIFNRSFGNANGFNFVIVTDSELEDLIPYINRYIASLPSKKEPETEYIYMGGNVRTDSVKLVRAAGDSERAVVSLVFQHTDLPEEKNIFDLKSDMLKDILRVKLLSQLRENMGMVYSVSVSSSSRVVPTPLARNMISFTSKPEDCGLLISTTKDIIKEMADDPDSFERELFNVKKNMINDMHVNVQEDTFWSTFIRNTTFNEQYDWSFVSNYEDLVNSITGEELSELLMYNFNKNNIIEAVLLPKK